MWEDVVFSVWDFFFFVVRDLVAREIEASGESLDE